jgi:hypothetical protein
MTEGKRQTTRKFVQRMFGKAALKVVTNDKGEASGAD